MATGAIVAVVAAQRNRVLRAFRDAGAVDAAHARTLEELGVRDTRMVRHMTREGYIIGLGPRYYLDVARFEEGRRRGQKIAVVAAAVIFIVVLLALALTGPR